MIALSLLLRKFVITALLVVSACVASWQWKRNHDGWKKERVRADSLVLDTLRLTGIIHQRESVIAKQSKQIDQATQYAYTYQQQKQRALEQSDQDVAKLSYTQKLAAYYKALVDNHTLPSFGTSPPPALTDSTVLKAGLMTARREAIERHRGDSLLQSVAMRDARIQALSTDKQTLRSGMRQLASSARQKIHGGIWPLNHKRRKQLRQLASEADALLLKTDSINSLN